MITRARAIARASYGSTTGAPERTTYSGDGPSTICRIQTDRPGPPSWAWNASRSAPAGLASQLARVAASSGGPRHQAVDGARARGGARGHVVVRLRHGRR